MIPRNLERIFWDTRLESIDETANKAYVIGRILDLGDEQAVTWLESRYSKSEIDEVVATSRGLSPRRRNYWKLKYRLAEYA